LADSCHCTPGAGTPLAADVKKALKPDGIVTPTGCTVIAGAVSTVRVAGLVSCAPFSFVNTARS
jgi:hypothetical protein